MVEHVGSAAIAAGLHVNYHADQRPMWNFIVADMSTN